MPKSYHYYFNLTNKLNFFFHIPILYLKSLFRGKMKFYTFHRTFDTLLRKEEPQRRYEIIYSSKIRNVGFHNNADDFHFFLKAVRLWKKYWSFLNKSYNHNKRYKIEFLFQRFMDKFIELFFLIFYDSFFLFCCFWVFEI